MKNATMGPVMSPQEMMETIERQRKTISNLNNTIDILKEIIDDNRMIIADKRSMLHEAWKRNDELSEMLGLPVIGTPGKAAPGRGIPVKGCLTVKLNPGYTKGGAR